MTTLITGAKGYLASNIKKRLPGDVVEYFGDVRTFRDYTGINKIIHFASPSERAEFCDTEKTVTTIINGTLNMIDLANKNNAKLIFASTMGVYEASVDDAYASCKLAAEFMIQNSCNSYGILRIPRVYSPCRNKGLMKQLKSGSVNENDKSKKIQFITLEQFLDQTINVIESINDIYEYNQTIERTIGEIETWITHPDTYIL